jgi:outer membrane protein OmpA-like peptidoglycan-associated protein
VPATIKELESLLAPEAMADILATPEPELINYQVGVDRAVNDLWGGWKLAIPLARTLRAQGVANNDSLSGYFLTTLARLRHGEAEAAERLREGYQKGGLRVDLVPIDVRERVVFVRDQATIGLDQERTLRAVADLVRANPFIQILQVQGHAAASEPTSQPLSQARARGVMDRLVTLGAPRERLAALGFGADYPNDDRDWRDRPGRDRRVDFLILRRDRKTI